jgi:TupA-like ATPgrasp
MSRSSKLRNSLQSLFYGLPMPAGLRRRLLFAFFNRRMPHFSKPKTFNDKVNWRILNDRRPLLEWTCDKLLMKEHAMEAALDGFHVPNTIWSGADVCELRNVELPEYWVLKPNHRSGLIYFGHGRPDPGELSDVTAGWLDASEWEHKGEWAYAKARPLLLVEELLGSPGCPPPDYKFFVFDGRAVAVQVDVDRHNAHRRRLYRRDWSPLDVRYGPYDLAPVMPPISNLARMLAVAERLGQPFDFIRVDLYHVDDIIEFGEFTPYPCGGLDRFVPPFLNLELGKAWILPRL